MEGPTDKEILKDRRLVPRNPFEVEATKSILLKHIEAGDITEQDIELMKNSYRTVTLVSFVRHIYRPSYPDQFLLWEGR